MEIKFLADVNIEKRVVDFLSQCGYDIKWIPDFNCAMDDAALLDLANRENRVLLTNDKDFGELVFLQKKVARGIILFRVKGESAKEKEKLIKKLILRHHDRILNHFVLITQTKFRFIPIKDIIP